MGMVYLPTFTIENEPNVGKYIPYMDPMESLNLRKFWYSFVKMENDSLNRELKLTSIYYVSLLEGSCLVRTGDYP